MEWLMMLLLSPFLCAIILILVYAVIGAVGFSLICLCFVLDIITFSKFNLLNKWGTQITDTFFNY